MLQPHPQEAEIYVAWESSTVSPAPYSFYVFLTCAFLFCLAAVGSADDKCIGIDNLHIDGCVSGVSSSLQRLWNSFTAEACHRN